MRTRSLLIAGSIAAATFLTSSTVSAKKAAPPARAGYGEPAPFVSERIEETILHDAKRDKDLTVSIDYPKAPGPFPVIVFSHGFGGSKDAYRSLTASWAAHGYVVVKPTHADSSTVDDIRDLLGESSVFEKQNEREWFHRARDLSFIIDSLPELEHRYFALRGKIDPKKIGVAGHSYGAFTALMVAGAQIATISGKPMPVNDSRVMAGLAMSPQGVSSDRGLTQDSWKDIRIPMMYMTGTLDRGTGETPQWRRDPFQYGPGGDKYFVLINGARHLSFTGRFADREAARAGDSPFGRSGLPMDPNVPTLPSTDPRTGDPRYNDPRYGSSNLPQTRREDLGTYRDEPVIFGSVLRISQAFWDAYLKGSETGKQYLASDQPKLESKIKLQIEKK
jgi:predicted dienelactone hydrolase